MSILLSAKRRPTMYYINLIYNETNNPTEQGIFTKWVSI